MPARETALAEAEIEYKDVPCKSIFVKFAVTDDKDCLSPAAWYQRRMYIS